MDSYWMWFSTKNTAATLFKDILLLRSFLQICFFLKVGEFHWNNKLQGKTYISTVFHPIQDTHQLDQSMQCIHIHSILMAIIYQSAK